MVVSQNPRFYQTFLKIERHVLLITSDALDFDCDKYC